MSAGPLRRRLTSPASSTVEMSTEQATAITLTPEQMREKFRKVTPTATTGKPLPSPPLTEETQSPTAPEGRPPSLESGSRHLPNNIFEDSQDAMAKSVEQMLPPKSIWKWAKAGTGRLALIGGVSQPANISTRTVTSIPNGGLQKEETPKDDFSVPSATSTEPNNEERIVEAAAAKMEGLGLSNSTVDSHFSQTKRSSDDLVASMNNTPSPQSQQWTRGEGLFTPPAPKARSPPTSPSPAPRNPQANGERGLSNHSPSPHRVPTYKIALTADAMSHSRVVS